MKFAGIQKTSYIDYPGELCTVIFSAGCNFRCSYCHNAELIKGQNCIDEEEIIAMLESRKKNIRAVCISGGEVTLRNEIFEFMQKLKGLGYKVKLDTNGTNFELLKELLENQVVDYIAMDIKAPLDRYDIITGVSVTQESILKSVELLKNSNIKYEFRTTVAKELFKYEDLTEIANWLKGSQKYALQNFRDNENVLIGEGKLKPFDNEELKLFKIEYDSYFDVIDLRI